MGVLEGLTDQGSILVFSLSESADPAIRLIDCEHLEGLGQSRPRLTRTSLRHTLNPMEVEFTPDLQAKIARLAAEQGRDTQALVREAVERFVDYDEWFLREVERGLAAADRGEFIEHEEISRFIDRRYPG